MKRFFGITHHSPSYVEELLADYRETLSKDVRKKFTVSFVFPEQKYEHLGQVVVVVGYKTLQRMIAMGHVKGHSVFLIESPVFCSMYRNITLLDAIKHKSYKFEFRKLTVTDIENAFHAPLRNDLAGNLFDTHEIIPNVLDDTPSSVLHHIQTFLYSIADADRRSRYQHEMFQCIAQNTPLAELPFINPKHVKHKNFLDWATSEEGAKTVLLLQKALARATGESVDYDGLEKEFGVSKFDIRYAMIIIRKSTVDTTEEDTQEMYQKAKGTVISEGGLKKTEKEKKDDKAVRAPRAGRVAKARKPAGAVDQPSITVSDADL